MQFFCTDGQSTFTFYIDDAVEAAKVRSSKRPVSKALAIIKKRIGASVYPIPGQALIGL